MGKYFKIMGSYENVTKIIRKNKIYFFLSEKWLQKVQNYFFYICFVILQNFSFGIYFLKISGDREFSNRKILRFELGWCVWMRVGASFTVRQAETEKTGNYRNWAQQPKNHFWTRKFIFFYNFIYLSISWIK